jgi:hypothetical protein
MKEIKNQFGHKLQGSKFMKSMVIKTLQFFPTEIINFITENCWFVSSFEDGWAFTLRGDELKKNEFLIFLSDELLAEDEKQIMWTIAHEIGHVILGHKNSIGAVQSKSEIKKQEDEADNFAKKYLFHSY